MKTIAIVGASKNPAKFGNKAVRAFVRQGWQVYPVHPNESSIEGLRVYASVRDLPARPRLVSLYVPPEVGLEVLPDIVARGCEELWLNPGADSDALVEAAERHGLCVIRACSLVAHGMAEDAG